MRKRIEQPFLVAGGGLGGLAAALGLARTGVPVTVLEQASALGGTDAGLQLGPNAFHALDRLGVGDAVRAMPVCIDGLRLMDALSGEEIMHLPLDAPFRHRFGNPYAAVGCGDLHGVLLRACRDRPNIVLRTGAEVVAYDQDAAGVTVELASGERVVGAALIGADGMCSDVRRQLVDDGPPLASGHMEYRSVIPAARMAEDLRGNAVTLWAGPGCHIVHYPLSGGTVFDVIVVCRGDARECVTGLPASEAEVRAGLRHVHPRAQAIVQQGSDWRRWTLCDREPVARWVAGRVALLGDAAHPMLPYLAQGAGMALEDAVCLAHMVGAHPGEIGRALEAYRGHRMLRTARVVVQSRAIGEHIYHPSGVHALLRNAMLAGRTPTEHYDSLAWLYGETGPDEPRPDAVSTSN